VWWEGDVGNQLATKVLDNLGGAAIGQQGCYHNIQRDYSR